MYKPKEPTWIERYAIGMHLDAIGNPIASECSAFWLKVNMKPIERWNLTIGWKYVTLNVLFFQ